MRVRKGYNNKLNENQKRIFRITMRKKQINSNLIKPTKIWERKMRRETD